MQFYEVFTLNDSEKLTNIVRGLLKAPTVEEISAQLAKSSTWRTYYAKQFKITNCYYRVTCANPYERATIQLIVESQDTGGQLCVSGLVLSTVQANCGALHLAQISTDFQRCGLGSLVLNEVLKWATTVGYTMIFGNTAGREQNTYALPFFKKLGFVQFGKAYVNGRSGNTNVWLQKFLRPCDPNDHEDEEEDYDEYEDNDYEGDN